LTLVQTNKANARSERRANNRRIRRQRRPFNGGNNVGLPVGKDILHSTQHLIQSLFYQDHGVFRGLSKGSSTTAVTIIKQSFIINCTALQTLQFSWTPSELTAPNWYSSRDAAVATHPYDAGSVAVGGPFSVVNPSSVRRLVGARMIIYPVTPLLTSSGGGKLAYCPTWQGAIAANYVPSSLDNMEWTMPWPATESIVMNWVPNQFEVDMTASTTPSATFTGQFTGYFNAGANTTSWRVEIQSAIEYVPTLAYRPYVMRSAPKMHPEAYHYANQLINTNWSGLVMMDYKKYMAVSQSFNQVGDGHREVHNLGLTNSGTMGSGISRVLADTGMFDDQDDNGVPDIIDGGVDYLADQLPGSQMLKSSYRMLTKSYLGKRGR
jgi:hypothetical protein